MSALLELVRETPPEDRAEVAKMLKPYLVPEKPKQPQVIHWMSLDKFTKKLPIKRDKEWVRMFILPLKPLENMVINISAGRGRPTRVNPEVVDWVVEHQSEIDWNQSLPR